MRVITCPEVYTPQEDDFVIFMAGGITGCPDWQSEVICRLQTLGVYKNFVLLNPRRNTFDITKTEDSEFQIRWEYQHIRLADVVSFWFPKEGKCMITLYELGEAIGSNRRICVGCHPEYERAFDIYQQLKLVKPDLKIHNSLEDLYGLPCP